MDKELCKECKIKFDKKYYEKKIDILEAELNNPINFMHGETKLMFHPRESFTKVQNLGHKLVGFEDEIRYLKKQIKDGILESKDKNVKEYYIKNAIVSSPERLVEELSAICSKQDNKIDELNQNVEQLKQQIKDGIKYFKMEVPLYSNEDGQEEINRIAEKADKCIKIFKGEEKYEKFK